MVYELAVKIAVEGFRFGCLGSTALMEGVQRCVDTGLDCLFLQASAAQVGADSTSWDGSVAFQLGLHSRTPPAPFHLDDLR